MSQALIASILRTSSTLSDTVRERRRTPPAPNPPNAGDIDSRMSLGVAIALGAVAGLVLGIVVALTTDLPLAPEVGLVLGAAVGWLSRRGGA